MRVTRKDIVYDMAWCGKTKIPKGTKVIPATNLPADPDLPRYWAENWDSMSETELSWARNYGFLLTEDDVEEQIYCPVIKRRKYLDDMCCSPMTIFHRTETRKQWRCEVGHTRVSVLHCGVWTLIEYDAQECDKCDQIFNLSGQDLRPQSEWEEDYYGEEEDYRNFFDYSGEDDW